MKVKYNRVSTILQTGNRFKADTDHYDMTLLDKVSGSVSFMDRNEAKKLVQYVEEGKITELVTEEFSRLGRNTGDVISTLDWLDSHRVNVKIRNLGIESRPNGKRNPVWKILSATMSSLYEMELENIKERTQTGRLIYLQNGIRLKSHLHLIYHIYELFEIDFFKFSGTLGKFLNILLGNLLFEKKITHAVQKINFISVQKPKFSLYHNSSSPLYGHI